MNYVESRKYIKSISKYGSVLGLNSINMLLEKLNHPEQTLKVVHVAGTNGKGSVIAYIESILICAGYKVGKYTSPAVFDYREIFQINGVYIEKAEYARCMTMVKATADEMEKEGFAHPTPFEIETAVALLYFKRNKCDIVLLETGMGGATDATNVLKKVLCSVITSISLDHMNFLGNTVEEIAGVKAGIIKEKCDAVLYPQDPKIKNVIADVCKEKKAKLTLAGTPKNIFADTEGYTVFDYTKKDVDETGDSLRFDCIKIRMSGAFQPYNAVVAIETALILQQQGFNVREYIRKGLKYAKLSGRFETIMDKPQIIIDGAHNPGAAKKLRDSVQMYFTNKRITLIMGVLADKDYDGVAEIMMPLGESVVTVTPDNQRALSAEALKTTVLRYHKNVVAAESVERALQLAMDRVKNGNADVIIAFGSLSYLGELKRIVDRIKNS